MAMPSAAAAGDLGLQVGMHPRDDQELPRLLGGKSVGDGAATLNDQPISSATPAPRVPSVTASHRVTMASDGQVSHPGRPPLHPGSLNRWLRR
jgi:hypothetical protein